MATSTADVDAVIAALSDAGRRAMLDALRRHDGQSVTELGAAVPALGRHAVLKHIGVLENAGLVVTHKAGRTRLCYLNAVPLVDLAGRWLDDFGVRWGPGLSALRSHLETPNPFDTSAQEPTMTDSSVPAPQSSSVPLHKHSVVIDAPPERVWQALMSENQAWFFGTTLNVDCPDGLPAAGAQYTYTYPSGAVAAEGEILQVIPEQLLEMTFSPVWDDAVRDEPGFRMVWRIEIVEDTTMVSVEHYDLDASSATAGQVSGGAVYLISNLKTWVESGAPMRR